MHQGAKIALASGIVLSGLVGAALFRKSPSPTTPNKSPETPFDRPMVPLAAEDSPAAAQLLGRIDPVSRNPVSRDPARPAAAGRFRERANRARGAQRPLGPAAIGRHLRAVLPRKEEFSSDAQPDEQGLPSLRRAAGNCTRFAMATRSLRWPATISAPASDSWKSTRRTASCCRAPICCRSAPG